MRFSIITAATALLVVSACSGTATPTITTYKCGADTVSVSSEGGNATLVRGGKEITLTQVQVASGAKYQSAKAKTAFWTKGDDAKLTTGKKKPVSCKVEAPKA